MYNTLAGSRPVGIYYLEAGEKVTPKLLRSLISGIKESNCIHGCQKLNKLSKKNKTRRLFK